jgi:hypothetical protein
MEYHFLMRHLSAGGSHLQELGISKLIRVVPHFVPSSSATQSLAALSRYLDREPFIRCGALSNERRCLSVMLKPSSKCGFLQSPSYRVAGNTVSAASKAIDLSVRSKLSLRADRLAHSAAPVLFWLISPQHCVDEVLANELPGSSSCIMYSTSFRDGL